MFNAASVLVHQSLDRLDRRVQITQEVAMLDIKVLGTGCAGCLKMEQMVIDILLELGIHDAKVELVTEQRMIDYGLLADRAPGLLINGRLTWAGSVPAKEQLAEWLKQAAGLALGD
jgi:hypothetical protein